MRNKYLLLLILLSPTFLIGCKEDRKVAILEKNSEKINRTCPVRVDSLVVLDSTYYNKEKNSMTYFYSTFGELDDSALLNKNYASIKSSLGEAIDNSVDLQRYKKYGVTLIYEYCSSSKGNVLATFTLPTKQEKKR